MELELTAVFRGVPEGYIAFVEELPRANTQGATLEEARANLKEAVALVLEANRALASEEGVGADLIRESLKKFHVQMPNDLGARAPPGFGRRLERFVSPVV